MEKFDLVIPAYNEAPNLPALIRRAIAAAVKSELNPERFQIVLVQNGSLDNSDDVLAELKRDVGILRWLRVVKVEKNRGYGFGIRSGLMATTADIVGWTHADQQCDPADAIKAFHLVSQSQNKKLLVKGVRTERKFRDRIVSRVFEMFARIILRVKVSEMNAQPKVFRRDLLASLKQPPDSFAFDLYVLYQASKEGYQFKTIPVAFPPRIHGLSKWASTFLSRYKTIFAILRYMMHLCRQEGRL